MAASNSMNEADTGNELVSLTPPDPTAMQKLASRFLHSFHFHFKFIYLHRVKLSAIVIFIDCFPSCPCTKIKEKDISPKNLQYEYTN